MRSYAFELSKNEGAGSVAGYGRIDGRERGEESVQHLAPPEASYEYGRYLPGNERYC